MFKRTFTNLIEPLINDRFNQLNQSIDALKGLQITSIQNLQNQITNLNLDDLDIPSAYDIASEISIDTSDIDIEVDYSALARHLSSSIEIDASDIASEISADEIANHINTYDIARNISARDIASNIQIDSGDIAITIASDIKDGLSDLVGTTVVNELKVTFDILLSRLTAIETQLATLSKPKATKKPTVKKPVAKKPTGKTTATKKPVTKKVVTTKKATAKK